MSLDRIYTLRPGTADEKTLWAEHRADSGLVTVSQPHETPLGTFVQAESEVTLRIRYREDLGANAELSGPDGRFWYVQSWQEVGRKRFTEVALATYGARLVFTIPGGGDINPDPVDPVDPVDPPGPVDPDPVGWVAPPGYTLRDGNGDLIEEFVLVFTSNTGNGRGGEYTSPATVTGSWAAQDGRHTSELLGRHAPSHRYLFFRPAAGGFTSYREYVHTALTSAGAAADWGFDDRQDLFDDAVDGDTIEIVSGSDYLYAFVRNERGAWVSGTDYAIGDVVTHGGTTYGRRTDPNAHDETTVPSDVLPWQAE